MLLYQKRVEFKKLGLYKMPHTNKIHTFSAAPGFCSDCGSILPPLREKGGVECYTCSRKFSADCM